MNNLQLLADKLQVPVEMLWKALMRQAIISATVDIIFYILVALFVYGSIYFFVICKRKVNQDDYNKRWDEEVYIVACIIAVPALILVIYSIANLQYTISGFFNKEFWALHEVLSIIGK